MSCMLQHQTYCVSISHEEHRLLLCVAVKHACDRHDLIFLASTAVPEGDHVTLSLLPRPIPTGASCPLSTPIYRPISATARRRTR
eukprot:4685561-Pleurochrysis_carterae.AAC.1